MVKAVVIEVCNSADFFCDITTELGVKRLSDIKRLQAKLPLCQFVESFYDKLKRDAVVWRTWKLAGWTDLKGIR